MDSKLLFIHLHQGFIYIYVWKLNQTVLELDFWAVNFLFLIIQAVSTHTPFLVSSPVAFTFVNVLVLNIAEKMLAGR
jgi:hypothetical protein